jgi:hypothetical protein
MRRSETVLDVLRLAALSRSIFPVWLPGHVLLPTAALLDAVRGQRDELLAAVRRRVLYKQISVLTQLLGLGVSWAGVAVHARQVMLAGLIVAAVGAALGLFGKDRLVSLDTRIENLATTQRVLVTEWLSMALEVGPYSYARTAASGVSMRDVLDDRRSVITPSAVDALAEWLESLDTHVPPSQRWSQLGADLLGLAMIDERGQAARRRLEVVFDVVYTALLLMVVVAAVASVTFALPGAAIATVATLVVLGGRAAHDVTLTVFPGQPKVRSAGAAELASWRRFCARSVTELSSVDVDTICDASFLIPRTMRQRRTVAGIEKGFIQAHTTTGAST